jgi:beta-lactam-binding protein with PASTA domain
VPSSWTWFEAIVDLFTGTVDRGSTRMRPRSGPVPDVRGLPLDLARRTLAGEGFKADVVALEPEPARVMGTVVAQRPAPGTRWHRSRRVTLDVAHPRATPSTVHEPPDDGRTVRPFKRPGGPTDGS